MNILQIIEELRSEGSTLSKLAAEELERMRDRIDELEVDLEFQTEKRQRNLEIFRKKKAGERTKDLAQFYKLSEPAISRIYYREAIRAEQAKYRRKPKNV